MLLISSHILDELARLATNYGFIDGGHLLKEMSAEELEKHCRKCIRAEVSSTKTLACVLDEMKLEYHIVNEHTADIFAELSITKLVETFLGALFPILHYMDNIDENSGWNMDSTIFIYALFVPLMVSLLTALFIGTDYSDGTMRNKLIAGHVRRKIYVANLILNVQASFMLLFVGVRITAALNEPETYDAYSYMSEGVTVEEDETPNPNYVSGTKRQVYLFLNEFLPGGQMLRLSSMNAEHLGRYAIYDSIIFMFTTSCGILIFKSKNLK